MGAENEAPLPGEVPIALGLLGFVALMGPVSYFLAGWIFADARELLSTSGLPLPAASEAMLSGALPGSIFLLASLGFAAALVLGLKRKRGAALGVAALFLLLIAPLIALGALAVAAPLLELQSRMPLPDKDPIPGADSSLARDVEAAFRASIQRGVGTFAGPEGETRRYLIYTGPGVSEPAPTTLPPYEEARKHPGCLVLPYGPAGNTSSQDEVRLIFPTGVEGGLSAKDLVARFPAPAPRWTVAESNRGQAVEGYPVRVYPGVLSAGREGFGYALTLKRARLDTMDRGHADVSQYRDWLHPQGETRLDMRDRFADELFELQISLFRDFTPVPEGVDVLVPRGSLPTTTFVTLVGAQ